MGRVFVRSAHNYDMRAASRESATETYARRKYPVETGAGREDDGDMDRAVQSEKDEADINVIVKRFGVTGQMPQRAGKLPSFGDYTGIEDFRSAMDVVVAAKEEFMWLPAEVRSRFGNDPQAYLEFCSDPKNLDELRKMGLAEPLKEEVELPPQRVVVVSEDDDGKDSFGKNVAGSSKAGS